MARHPAPPLFPEDQHAAAHADAILKAREKEIVEHHARFQEQLKKERATPRLGQGFPLRPVFLPRALLSKLGVELHRTFRALQKAVARHAGNPVALQQATGLPREWFEHLPRETLRSPAVCSVLRPDGFLSQHGFTITELNTGNGTLISNAYTDLLHRFFQGSPVMEGFGGTWYRPVQDVIALVHKTVGHQRGRLGLFLQKEEHAMILGWEERYIQQARLAVKLFCDAGFDAQLMDDRHLEMARGKLFFKRGQQRHRVSGLVLVSSSATLLDRPKDLARHPYLLGLRAGDAPIIKPLAAVMFEKSAMPLLRELHVLPRPLGGGMQLSMQDTDTLHPEGAATYRLHREGLVLKRAFEGKDTIVGCATSGREWNHHVERALRHGGYVVQEFAEMPQAVLPMVLGKRIEWLPVRVEMSPFLVGGRFSGAIVRYAPLQTGPVYSPPPPDMALTTVVGT
jgi:hypothetical protein